MPHTEDTTLDSPAAVSGAPASPETPAPSAPQALFVQGSTLKHTISMTMAGAIGLFALFFVDLINIIYIGMLGDPALTAAVGFAATVFFLLVSVGIGMSIAGAALVSRAWGHGHRADARRIAGSFLLHTFITGALSAALLGLFADHLLTFMGAQGAAFQHAHRFLMISLPSMPLLALGMGTSGILRAVGDGRRSMFVTLAGGVATALLDPIFIFGLGWGIDGAAVASNLARVVLMLVGFHGVLVAHQLVERPSLARALQDGRAIWAIALPAVLTNIATPVANSYITAAVSPFGDAVVAGLVMISRLSPLAFGALFALSGAVGPILGQNLGARKIERVRQAFTDALLVTGVYVLAVWVLLFALQKPTLWALGAQGEAAGLVLFFIHFIALSWFFHGVLFVANAAFNSLGYPLLSTAFNWGKATLGTIPFVMLGTMWYGAEGALIGQALGAILFGLLGIAASYAVIARLKSRYS